MLTLLSPSTKIFDTLQYLICIVIGVVMREMHRIGVFFSEKDRFARRWQRASY